jgi:hypothetical protein
VLVLEQVVAGKVEAAAHDARDRRVLDLGLVALARLAEEVEAHARAARADVAPAQRRDAERAVLAPVLLAADAHERLVHHLHDRPRARAPWAARQREVAPHGAPDAR